MAVIQRDFRLDALRVAAAFTVVWLHISAGVVSTHPDAHRLAWWVGNVADAFSRWCVPAFVMISGALLLAQPCEAAPLHFYRRRVGRLIVPLVFWTVFYIAFRAFQDGHFNVLPAAQSIVQGKPYFHLWYFYMLMGLYLVTPFIRPLIATGSRQLTGVAVVVLFLMASAHSTVASLVGGRPAATFLAIFPSFIAYFVAGHYLRALSVRIPRVTLVIVAVSCGALIALGAGVLLGSLGVSGVRVMYGYLNPLVILMSLAIYQIALQMPLQMDTGPTPQLAGVPGTASRWVCRLAPVTLGIYAIHPFWMVVVGEVGLSGLSIHPAVGIPLTTGVVFVLSAASAGLLANIPYLKSTVT